MVLIISVNPARANERDQETVLVPLKLAKFAASHYVKRFYSETKWKFFNAETYYDLDEQPIVYAIVLISTNADKSTTAKIKKNITKQYLSIQAFRKAIQSAKNELISGKAKMEKIAFIQRQMSEAVKSLKRTDRYLTLLCGATEEHVPVILAYRGLPVHMTTLPDIEDKISKNNEIQGLLPSKVYYMDMFNQYYSLERYTESVGGQETISEGAELDVKLIDLRGDRVSTLSKKRHAIHEAKKKKIDELEKMPQEKQRLINARKNERKQILKNKWERIKSLYQEEAKGVEVIEMDQSPNKQNEEMRESPILIETETSKKTELPATLPRPHSKR